MSTFVIETSDASFARDIGSATSRLDVIEFSDLSKINTRGQPNASARMDAVIDGLASDSAGTGIRFFRVSVEFDKTLDPVQVTRNYETAQRFNINHAPTLVFLRLGQEVHDQVVGYYDEVFLKRKIESALAVE